MPFDGCYLHKIVQELDDFANAKIEKIGQPNKDCIVLHLRTSGPAKRLMLACGSTPRMHLTDIGVEYPATPPMFCILLRKHIGNGKIRAIRQLGLDRVVTMDIEATNDLGDRVRYQLIGEFIGRQGNLILVNEDGKIVDALRRIDLIESPDRPILSGATYQYPLRQKKENILTSDCDLTRALLDKSQKTITKALMELLEGLSPYVADRMAEKVCKEEKLIGELTPIERTFLDEIFYSLKAALEKGGGKPVIIKEPKEEFTFYPVAGGTEFETYSKALEEFYRWKTSGEGVRTIGEGLRKQVQIICERLERKLAIRIEEMGKTENRDQYKLYGDLLSANLYKIDKGMDAIVVVDYTSPTGATKTIPLDTRKNPGKNVQKYYEDYRKATNAKKMLESLIEECKNEIEYINTVKELLERCTTEGELIEIRNELLEEGYLKTATPQKGQKDFHKRRGGMLQPLKYQSSNGFIIWCGRNNIQNDELTLRKSKAGDVWFHIQKNPGSHVVLETKGKKIEEIPDETIEEAAMIAALNSSGRNSTRVPIDYTLVKNIKKPNGAKPGKVVYDTYWTMLSTPNPEKAEKLKIK